MRRLRERDDARADKVLAQQHAEHRRLGRIFKARVRQMDAGVAGARGDQQAGVPLRGAQGEEQHVPLGLLHLVDLRALERGAQLRRQGFDTDGVQRHAQPSIAAAKSVFSRSCRPCR